MSFDQGAAWVDGQPPKTKKALRDAAVNAASITLRSTSAFGGWEGLASSLPEGLTFTVVGPDPYRDRRWYANITRKAGKVTVK